MINGKRSTERLKLNITHVMNRLIDMLRGMEQSKIGAEDGEQKCRK